MRVLRSLDPVPADARGASAAMGNFDGVHLGHRHVIDAARAPGRPLGVVTFEPHPREVFARLKGAEAPPFRLMSPQARASRLAGMGVDLLWELPFPEVAPLTAEDFAGGVLRDTLGLSRVAVGADFRFGRGRAGDVETLREAGLEVAAVPLVGGPDGEVSSTAIRRALSDGRPRDAAAMLGHWHRIEGPVIHGEKRGRTLGWPTANMGMEGLHLPRLGVYAVLADVLDGPHRGRHRGVASLGVRPMFGENAPNLETFLFDFSGDLYGARMSVALVAFLRAEASFEGVDALVAQMERDGRAAREALDAV